MGAVGVMEATTCLGAGFTYYSTGVTGTSGAEEDRCPKVAFGTIGRGCRSRALSGSVFAKSWAARERDISLRVPQLFPIPTMSSRFYCKADLEIHADVSREATAPCAGIRQTTQHLVLICDPRLTSILFPSSNCVPASAVVAHGH